MAQITIGKVAITPAGTWDRNTSYSRLSTVIYDNDGCGYVSLKPNIGVEPGTDESVWIKSVNAGSSIYELSVKHGLFEGSEEEFVQQYNQAVESAQDAANAANTAAESATTAAITAQQKAAEANAAASAANAAASNANAVVEEFNSKIVQEKGNAQDKVMSQKVVTDALNASDEKLSELEQELSALKARVAALESGGSVE